MTATPLHVLSLPEAIGEAMAERLLARIASARRAGQRFLLGCPTGRSPRPIYGAMARRLAATPQDLSSLVLVMMDEYLVPNESLDEATLRYAPADRPWSCHHFAQAEMAEPWNRALPATYRLRDDALWFPDPRDPAAYDRQIADAGGVNLFLLASGGSDGHVAFNPPGSPRASRTRVIPLSESTRRDNLQTFPTFGTLAAVPHHGVSVGIATIAAAREAVMVVWGAGKRLTLARMLGAERYDPDWPATVIHECPTREILCDTDAAAGLDDT